MALTDEQIAKVATDHGFEVLERISTQLRATGQADVAGRVDFVSALFRSALSAQPAPCGEYVAVRADAVEWLKNHYPALCEKSGMCERVAGRLYTRTTLSAQPAKPAITEQRVSDLKQKYTLSSPVVVQDEPDAHNVYLQVGNQRFCVTPMHCESIEEANHMQTMLANALAALLAAEGRGK